MSNAYRNFLYLSPLFLFFFERGKKNSMSESIILHVYKEKGGGEDEEDGFYMLTTDKRTYLTDEFPKSVRQ
jgi:hypothetical protein